VRKCLTKRHEQLLIYLASGKTVQDFADAHNISVHTASQTRKNLYTELGIHSIVELVHYAVLNNYISLPIKG
jgi:DNA-binding CsgD family transcriptional regulator